MTPAWDELDRRGFLVVPGFLDEESRQLLAADFARGAPPTAYPYGFKLIGRAILAHVWPRISALLAELRAAGRHATDVLSPLAQSHYITTGLVERTLVWHQDVDLDYTLTGDHVGSLNFWIPVLKPERERSNLCLVPFDELARRCPGETAALVGSGARRFFVEEGRTRVVRLDDDGPRDERTLAVSLEELAVTPALDAGDLLLVRGDVIHRTQDDATERLAASIRATASHKLARRDRWHGTGPATLRRCFAGLEGDAISVRRLVEFIDGERRD